MMHTKLGGFGSVGISEFSCTPLKKRCWMTVMPLAQVGLAAVALMHSRSL